MTIKHFSLCGGGIVGLVMYGIVKRLNQLKIWELKNIETIYSCSVGSIIGLMIILDIPWEWLDDFWIKRPWYTIFDFTKIDYLKYINDKGIFDEKTWIDIVKPLLKSKKLNEDITLLELYNNTNIEFNMYVTEMNNVCKKILNYKTYPDMRVTYAIYLTTCIPYISKPAFFENSYYFDGGLTNNIPINDCFYNNKCDYSEIINITNEISDTINFDHTIKYSIDNSLDNYLDNSCNINNTDSEDIDLEDVDGLHTDGVHTDGVHTDREEIDIVDIQEEPIGREMIDVEAIDGDTSNIDNKNDTFNSVFVENLDNNCNIIQFSIYLLKNLVRHICNLNTINNINIPNTINSCITPVNIDINLWTNIFFNRDYIANTINYGCNLAESFYKENNTKNDR